jgi:hypothetical protein
VQFSGSVPVILDGTARTSSSATGRLSVYKNADGKYKLMGLIDGDRVDAVVSKTTLDKALTHARRGQRGRETPDPVGVTFIANDLATLSAADGEGDDSRTRASLPHSS